MLTWSLNEPKLAVLSSDRFTPGERSRVHWARGRRQGGFEESVQARWRGKQISSVVGTELNTPIPQPLTAAELSWHLFSPQVSSRFWNLCPPLRVRCLINTFSCFLLALRRVRKICGKRLLASSCSFLQNGTCRPHWTDFHEILYFTIFLKVSRKFDFL